MNLRLAGLKARKNAIFHAHLQKAFRQFLKSSLPVGLIKESADHRQLADEMEIFFFDEEIGAGLPVWLPNGVAIRDQLEIFVKELERQGGYPRVVGPHFGRQDLYEKSGHLSCFNENMYPPINWQKEGDEDKKAID